MVTRSQGSEISPHQKETVTHLNLAGGSIQAAPTGGRTNPNTGTDSKYHGKASGRRGHCRGSAETTGRRGGGTIGHERRIPGDMAIGGNRGERPRCLEVGKNW